MLECVQGVVMDEDPDRTLHRKQVRRVVYHLAQPGLTRVH
jgi:hypothetical protein